MASIVKVRDVVVYEDERYYCGPGPSAALLPDGRIMLAFRRVRSWLHEGVWGHYTPSTEACLTYSADGGQTWSPPHVFTAGDVMNQNLTRLDSGTVLLITQMCHLLPQKVYQQMVAENRVHPWVWPDERFGYISADAGIWAMRSADDGQTWDGPFAVSPVPGMTPTMPGWPSAAEQRASATPLADGFVGLAVYGPVGKTRDACDVWFMVSDDEGQTWMPRGQIARDPEGQFYYNETGVYQCASGKLVAFLRVEKDPDKTIHLSTSADGGYTWTEPQRTGVRGYPCQAARLASGNVLLAYGYRYEPMGVRARLLDPECTDIAGADQLVLRDDGGMRDLGYPHVLPLPDGTALVTYYHNVGGGARHVAGTVVAEA